LALFEKHLYVRDMAQEGSWDYIAIPKSRGFVYAYTRTSYTIKDCRWHVLLGCMYTICFIYLFGTKRNDLDLVYKIKLDPNINRAQYRKKKMDMLFSNHWTIANYYIVCWDAVRSVFLATGWLLVKHNSVFICFLIIQSYLYWPCDVLLHFPVLVNSLTRCAPAFSSCGQIARKMCSRNFQF